MTLSTMSTKIGSEEVLHPTPDHLNQTTQNGILAHQEPIIPSFSLLAGSDGSKHILPTVAKLCGTVADDIEDAYPCTVVQEALVALSVKTPRMYVARYVYRLKNGIPFEQFRTAWDATVKAHTIMRTRVVQLGSRGVVQVVCRQGIECQKSDNLQEYLAEDCQKEMPLGAPLARAGFIQDLDPESPAHLVITLHHALYDDWSLALILKHIEAAYAEQRVPDQHFSRFTEYCLKASNEESEKFWSNELTRMSPTSFPAVPAESYTPAATKSFILETKLAQSMDFDSLSTTVKMAWAILISRHTASEEVVFGVTDTGRRATMPAVDLMSGPTIATFPFQVLVQGDQSIGETWRQLHHRRAEMVQHEQFGLNQMRILSSDAAALCKFQSLIVLQPKRRDDYSLFSEVTQTQDLENHATFGTYPITLVVEPDGNTISVQAVYDHHIVPEVQMKRILQQHSHIMKWISRAENSCVDDIEGLCPEDQMDLKTWNSLRTPENVQSCVHDLISEMSRSQPQVTAVCAWNGELSYERLETLSSGFAVQLLEEGLIRPDTVVPLYFEKSKWTAVAILGVIKAGGAFALLDPAIPLKRLQMICEDTRAPFVVCPPELASNAKDLTGSVIVIDTDDSHDSGLAVRALKYHGSEVSPSNILYVVYTSGSTGQPKGVVIEHGAFCSSALAYIKVAEMDRETRALQFASYSFDVSVTDHLATLLAGGTICIPSPDDRMNDIISVVSRFNINYADFTPSFLRSLRPEDMPSLRAIAVGGEALSRAVIDIWGSHVRLINIYGPAECCVLTTIQSQVTLDSDPLNIGFGTGAVCWVADSKNHNRLVPIGAIGELLVGGPIVGRGYLNDPQKTAAAFVDTPDFLHKMPASSPHNRVYKTGDLVQYAPDGSIRFLGRKDMQVKLRGQRIELGEIEHCLNQCLEVAGLVVDVIKPRNNSELLVAFILRGQVEKRDPTKLLRDPEDDFRSSIIQAEAHLRSQLPGYMVPNLFFQLETMPTTASGKIDRKRLREHTSSLPLEDLQRYAAAKQDKRYPSTPQEKVLHSLVTHLLGLKPEAAGMDDTMFSLGGDSITAMRLAGLALEKGKRLTVADIFAHPKLCDMALVMEDSDLDSAHKQYGSFSLIQTPNAEQNDCDYIKREAMNQCNVTSDSIEDVYPCTALQEGMMFLSIANPGTYQCRYLYTIPPEMTEEQLQQAWRQTTEANTILRTRLFQAGSSLYQAVIKDDNVVWDSPDNLDDYIVTDMQRHVDVGGQLVRMAIAPATPDRLRVWVLSLHHSLCDGWTVRQLLEQTAAAYRGQTLGVRPFSSFVEYVVGKEGDEAKAFWQTELENLDPRAAAFPSVPSSQYSPTAGAPLTYPVMGLSNKRTGHTLTTVIRLAIASVISRFTGSSDVVVGVTTSGRSASLSGILSVTGPTLSSYPMRIQLNPLQSIEAVLSQIQSTSIRVLDFEHFGLQNIRKVSPEATRACQFQTYLNIWPLDESEAPDPFVQLDDAAGRTEFGGFALAMSCMLESQNSGFTVVANYDPEIISEDQLTSLLSLVEQAVRQIWSDDSIALGQIQAEDSETGIKEPLLISSQPSDEMAWQKPNVDPATPVAKRLPSTPVEIQMHKLWAQVLNLNSDQIGMDDSFFQLGGDSIGAMRLVSCARTDGLSLTVANIFKNPVLASLALSSQPYTGVTSSIVPRSDDLRHHLETKAILQELYLKKAPFNQDDVVDIAPTTEVQADLAGRPHVYWLLEIKGTLDTTQLNHACATWSQKHSILRTAFLDHRKQLVQVVLREHNPSLVPNITEKNPMDVAIAWSKEDSSTTPILGIPSLSLALVQQDPSNSVLVVRLSHAQYDGLCIQRLLEDLLDLYHGKEVAASADFAKYVHHCRDHESEAFGFWKSLLMGAEMTPPMLPKELSVTCEPSIIESVQQVPLMTLPPGITMATVVKAAWAMVQFQFHQTNDVVFGQLVVSRNTGVEELDQVVGPCINRIPVRVQRVAGESPLRFLQRIQQQHADSLQFDTPGLKAIVKGCTDGWSPDTMFGSFINHIPKDSADDEFESGGLTCRLDAWTKNAPPPNIRLTSTEGEMLKIRINASSEISTKAHLDELNARVCKMILELLHDVYTPFAGI
ncbi:hypothetical protein N7517_005253 [Penicillium concentricum]|uniref:Carrier domain-containing protein n=1 Tax=Penicillium concentricum TaxID=293559 RepID=A0A9W9S7T7_9EURO|nr:uncharacterized protein N7517_005253 [Penicillium concentricum]KAJ5373247.1 hypothetical protein N7517_005253 [Penicillium concentricum]